MHNGSSPLDFKFSGAGASIVPKKYANIIGVDTLAPWHARKSAAMVFTMDYKDVRHPHIVKAQSSRAAFNYLCYPTVE